MFHPGKTTRFQYWDTDLGIWGAALAHDDTASDLRDAIALVTRAPGP